MKRILVTFFSILFPVTTFAQFNYSQNDINTFLAQAASGKKSVAVAAADKLKLNFQNNGILLNSGAGVYSRKLPNYIGRKNCSTVAGILGYANDRTAQKITAKLTQNNHFESR